MTNFPVLIIRTLSSLLFYIQELMGKGAKISFNPVTLVDSLDNKQISELMFAITAKMGNKADKQLEEGKLAVSC